MLEHFQDGDGRLAAVVLYQPDIERRGVPARDNIMPQRGSGESRSEFILCRGQSRRCQVETRVLKFLPS